MPDYREFQGVITSMTDAQIDALLADTTQGSSQLRMFAAQERRLRREKLTPANQSTAGFTDGPPMGGARGPWTGL